MPVYAALIDVDRGVLLWSPLLAKKKARLGVFELPRANFLSPDRLVVELPFLRGVFTLSHADQENACFLARGFRCPDPLEPEREATGPTFRPVLHHIAASARSEYAKPEPKQIILPDEVVVGFDFGLVDKTFGTYRHVSVPQNGCAAGHFAEAPRQHLGGNSSVPWDLLDEPEIQDNIPFSLI